jgi:diguanylate cyclase (GGDEF)-like protein
VSGLAPPLLAEPPRREAAPAGLRGSLGRFGLLLGLVGLLGAGVAFSNAMAIWAARPAGGGPLDVQALRLASTSLLLLAGLSGMLLCVRRVLLAEAALRQAWRAAEVGRAESAALLEAERQRAERAESAQRAELRAVLAGLGQGAILFGPMGRLVLANPRSVEILGLPEEGPPSGATFAELAEAATRGQAGPVMARLLPLVAARQEAGFVAELAEGRAVAAHHRPLADGGWLATFEDIGPRRAAEARLAHVQRHDPVTGLPNRILLEERLAALLAQPRRGEVRLAVLCLRLDQAAPLRETLGLEAADALLRAAARRLVANLRARRSGDLLARIGDDGFAIVIAGDARADMGAGVAALAERLLARFEEPFEVAGREVATGLAIGTAVAGAEGASAGALLRNAMLALRQAEEPGSPRHRRFLTASVEQAEARQVAGQDLWRALATPGAPEIEMLHRPLVSLATREVVGFSATASWCHPSHGQLSGDPLAALADARGLLETLRAARLARACADAAAWPGALRVAVALGEAETRRPGLAETVQRALAQARLDPARLELGIPAAALDPLEPALLAALQRLRATGMRLVLSEASGAGWPGALRAFDFDAVRFGPALVAELGTPQGDPALLNALLAGCARRGLPAIAEGVTRPEQLALLTGACVEAEGELLGPARLARGLAFSAAAPIAGYSPAA